MSQLDIAAYLSRRVLGRLLAGLVVIFSSVSLCVAQAKLVQSVKSSQPLQCGGKQYQLRLLNAEVLIQNNLAEYLAIVLTADDASESKIFGIYWIGASNFSPTHRDDTNGSRPGTALIPYGDGRFNGVPVVESFFSTANCSLTDPQVIGIRGLIRQQTPNHDYLRSATLRVLADDLSGQEVGVSANQVEDESSSENLALFNNLQNDVGFANAIHNYVRKLWAAGKQVGTESETDEVKDLKTNNANLQAQVKELQAEKIAFLGAAPLWLKIAFPFMVVLSLAGMTFFGLALYHSAKRKSKKASSQTRADAEASGPQATAAGDGSVSAPVNLSAEIASGVQNIKDTLQSLTSDIGVMKKSVAGFNGKLDARAKGSEALQNLWHRLYPSAYSSDLTDTLVRDVIQVLDLFAWLRSRSVFPDASIKDTVEQLKRTVTKLDTLRNSHLANQLSTWPFLKDFADSLEKKFASDAERLEDLRIIENEVRKLTGKAANASGVVTKLIAEHIEVQRKLERHEYPRDLNRAIDDVLTVQQRVIDQVKRALPDHEGKLGELVTSLVDEYLKAKPEAERARQLEAEKITLQTKLNQADVELEAGKQLANEVALEFNLKPDRLNGDEAITATLNRLKTERESSVYLQLRLGLSSALIAFEKTANRTSSEERNEVLEALHLHKVKDGIRKLLSQMEECTGEQLWHQGLSEGFSEKWLHYLIRADLLLRTYYVDHREFGWLSKAVSIACSAILAALYEFQVEVVEVGLLGERPKEMDTESVYPGLRNLPAVRDKVRLKIMNSQTEELVVDVTSFPYFVKGVQENRGRAALANPSAWRQH